MVNETPSRRDFLKAATAAGITGVAGCSDTTGKTSDEENGSDTEGGGPDQGDEDTGPKAEVDFDYRQFMDRSLINPIYITEQVNEDVELEEYIKPNNFRKIDLENTQEMFNALNEETAGKLNDYAIERAPWSVFGVEPREVAARGGDLDYTQTMLFNTSLDKIESEIRSGELEIDEDADDYLKFSGEHVSERTRNWNNEDSIFVAGYLQDTEMGPAGLVTQEIPSKNTRFTKSRNEVEQVADFHQVLLDGGDREPITENEEIGDLVDSILRRAEGSDRTLITLEKDEPYLATEYHNNFKNDHFEYVRNLVRSNNGGYKTEAIHSGETGIGELYYVEDPNDD